MGLGGGGGSCLMNRVTIQRNKFKEKGTKDEMSFPCCLLDIGKI